MAEIHEVVRSEEWTDEDDKDNEEVEMIAVEKNEIDVDCFFSQDSGVSVYRY